MLEAKSFMTETTSAIDENATLKEAASLMLRNRVPMLVVMKEDLPLACIGKKELVQHSLKKNLTQLKVKDVMDRNFYPVSATTPYYHVQEYFKKNGNARCPVLENGKLVGIITKEDILNTERDFTRGQQIRQELTLLVFGVVTACALFMLSPLGKALLDFS